MKTAVSSGGFYALVYLSLFLGVYSARTTVKDCSDERLNLREEKSDIIVTGTVEKVDRYRENDEYGAQILVKRVIKRPTSEMGVVIAAKKVIRVDGFGTEDICENQVRDKDSRIFLLRLMPNRALRLNGTLLRITLQNLERASAVVKGEPFKRHIIIDEPCETKYCPYNADCVVNPRSGRAECECITTCPVGYSPVCGSNGVSYPNECQMRRESCSKKTRVYLKHNGACLVIRN